MEIFKDEKIKKVLEKIKNAIKLTHFDGKVYVVGGAVRDALLGLPVKDLDIVVEYKGGGLMVAKNNERRIHILIVLSAWR